MNIRMLYSLGECLKFYDACYFLWLSIVKNDLKDFLDHGFFLHWNDVVNIFISAFPSFFVFDSHTIFFMLFSIKENLPHQGLMVDRTQVFALESQAEQKVSGRELLFNRTFTIHVIEVQMCIKALSILFLFPFDGKLQFKWNFFSIFRIFTI